MRPAPEGTRLAAWGDRAKAMLSDDRMDAVDRLAAYAKDHGHTLPELALSYLAEHADRRERHRRRDVAGAAARRTRPRPSRGTLTDAERAEVGELANAGG